MTISLKIVSICWSIVNVRRYVTHLHSYSSVEEAVKAAMETKDYKQIPQLLDSSQQSLYNPNPFSFLSTFSHNSRIQLVDEMMQSFIHIRPRFCNKTVYFCLLSYTLQSPEPFPLSLAVLQRTLRSGCVPFPQIHVLLSSAWLKYRGQSRSVSDILLEMKSIGYDPDSGTCNYLISSLCAVDQLVEAVNVLKGIGRVGCVPDLESFGYVIGGMCVMRKSNDAVEMMKEMVVKAGLMPREGMVVRVVAALRANREMWKAVELIEFLEKNDCLVGFDAYEMVIEGCLERCEYVLAAKVVMKMTDKGFIPHIGVRQKVVEGLANVGEEKLAGVVRQRFVEMRIAGHHSDATFTSVVIGIAF